MPYDGFAAKDPMELVGMVLSGETSQQRLNEQHQLAEVNRL